MSHHNKVSQENLVTSLRFEQPIGEPLSNWRVRPVPPNTPMQGRYCRIERLSVERHATQLFAANQEDVTGRNWTYLWDCAPIDEVSYHAWVVAKCATTDPLFHAVVDLRTEQAIGLAAFMRIDTNSGVMEVGHINFSPRLQRTVMATEAMFLMMQRAFDELGYRRYEWKCDSLNAPSCAAALRLGFQFEGIFRQALVYKGRSRDTAWFSVIDKEWEQIRRAFLRWLDAENFDASGRQVLTLTQCRGS